MRGQRVLSSNDFADLYLMDRQRRDVRVLKFPPSITALTPPADPTRAGRVRIGPVRRVIMS